MSREDASLGAVCLILFLLEWIVIFVMRGVMDRQRARDYERREAAMEKFRQGLDGGSE